MRPPLLEEIRDGMRLPRLPSTDPLEQVAAALAEQPALLILDNFEHLVRGGAPLVEALLQRVPTLTILVASRCRLNLPGEQVVAFPPLPTPMISGEGTWESATRVESASLTTDHSPLVTVPSVQLFVDRAQAARPGFQLGPRNAADVAQLCVRLEGLPLAIELAAGRAGALTPGQILERLSQPFTLLVSRGNAVEARHRSLRAALDWSYQLLPPALQRFFTHLSVFRGGWTLAAAEQVCETADTLDAIERLRECSLIVADEVDGEIRYRMLEALREYGQEQLAVEERGTLARRHAVYCLSLAEASERERQGTCPAARLDRLEREHRGGGGAKRGAGPRA